MPVEKYNLRTSQEAVTLQARVEEEPMDSADPISYLDGIAYLWLGQKWSDIVGEELWSLADNSTRDSVRLEDVPAGGTPTTPKLVFRPKEKPPSVNAKVPVLSYELIDKFLRSAVGDPEMSRV